MSEVKVGTQSELSTCLDLTRVEGKELFVGWGMGVNVVKHKRMMVIINIDFKL